MQELLMSWSINTHMNVMAKVRLPLAIIEFFDKCLPFFYLCHFVCVHISINITTALIARLDSLRLTFFFLAWLYSF